jgi:hypothetical protein
LCTYQIKVAGGDYRETAAAIVEEVMFLVDNRGTHGRVNGRVENKSLAHSLNYIRFADVLNIRHTSS